MRPGRAVSDREENEDMDECETPMHHPLTRCAKCYPATNAVRQVGENLTGHDWFEELPLSRGQQVDAATDRLRTKVAGSHLTGPDVAALRLVLGELEGMRSRAERIVGLSDTSPNYGKGRGQAAREILGRL